MEGERPRGGGAPRAEPEREPVPGARPAWGPREGSGADAAPWVLHGSDASYFTGKLEAIFRARGIPYRLEPFSPSRMRRCAARTGVVQVPQVECGDGAWLVDTTLILDHLEEHHAGPRLVPEDPATAFASRLLEDHADEWLWRPAMHYRWSFPENAALMGAWLAEHLREVPGPRVLKRAFWRWRQWWIFVRGDGVNRRTRVAVEASYLGTLDALEGILRRRPFLLGERPTAADFGFFGPFFRHFACDPVPGRILRARGPAVHEWVARMWNLSPDRIEGRALPSEVPEDLAPLLRDVAELHLPHLDAHADAYARGHRRARYRVRGTEFAEPVKPYRAWCRDRLHRLFVALPADARGRVAAALGSPEAVERLRRPSPRPAPPPVPGLPIREAPRDRPVDSWGRPVARR